MAAAPVTALPGVKAVALELKEDELVGAKVAAPAFSVPPGAGVPGMADVAGTLDACGDCKQLGVPKGSGSIMLANSSK